MYSVSLLDGNILQYFSKMMLYNFKFYSQSDTMTIIIYDSLLCVIFTRPESSLCLIDTYFLPTRFANQGMTLPGQSYFSIISQNFLLRRLGLQVPMCEISEIPRGQYGRKVSMNNECLFRGQLKLFLLYGKSTLGEIFPNHVSECVRGSADCQAFGDI